MITVPLPYKNCQHIVLIRVPTGRLLKIELTGFQVDSFVLMESIFSNSVLQQSNIS